jgi:crossover junction endodeoxyribonuclease RuvC
MSTPTLVNNMRVLAVDPGYDRCGVAVMEKQGGKEVLLFSTCIETNRSLPFSERLRLVGDELHTIITANSPEVLALETLYFSKNTKTAIAVAEARGVVTYCAASAGLPLYEYSPAAVKIAVTGVGNATKDQVMSMVKRLQPETAKRLMRDDEFDAIALGITHLAHHRPQ